MLNILYIVAVMEQLLQRLCCKLGAGIGGGQGHHPGVITVTSKDANYYGSAFVSCVFSK